MENLFNLIDKYAQISAQYSKDTRYAFESVLWKILGLANMPGPGEHAQLNFQADVFTKFINPILDKYNISGSINIKISINPDLSVNLDVSGSNNPQILEKTLQSNLAPKISNILKVAAKNNKISAPPNAVSWTWIENYG